MYANKRAILREEARNYKSTARHDFWPESRDRARRKYNKTWDEINDLREEFKNMPYNEQIIELEAEVNLLNRIWARGVLAALSGITLLVLGTLGVAGLGWLFLTLGAALTLGGVVLPPILQFNNFDLNPRVELEKAKRREVERVTKEYLP